MFLVFDELDSFEGDWIGSDNACITVQLLPVCQESFSGRLVEGCAENRICENVISVI